MENTDVSIDQLAADGRQLLNNVDGIDAHRCFNLWVNNVADWLDQNFPNSGSSASWSGLAASTLITGGHYYNNPQAWETFAGAVRERLSWLGQLSSGNPRANSSALPFPETVTRNTTKVFVVHGHDEEMKHSVARIVSTLKLDPIILHEQPNKGKTIIEKFESESDLGFAIVLMSPDDIAYPATGTPDDAKPRARQNVVLELGYFVGKLGRDRVMALKRGDVDVPTDLSGVVYTKYDKSGNWRLELVRELKACGYSVDANAIL